MEKTKVTQKMALNYVIENCDVPVDIKEKLMVMLAQVEKKATSSGKPTAQKLANDNLRGEILAEMKVGERYTITDMLKNFKCLANGDYTNQRISALVSGLIKDGKVERITEKRRSYFAVIGE